MRILLLRHGESRANITGELDTRSPGRPLTERGIAQAQAAAQALTSFNADMLFSSPLIRAQQTAEPLARSWRLTAMTVPAQEIGAGRWEGSTNSTDHARYLNVIQAWCRSELDLEMPCGTDGHEFLRRFDGAIATVMSSGAKRSVIVTHGSAIRAWVAQQRFPGSVSASLTSRLLNTGYVELHNDGSGWVVSEWHDQPAGGGAVTSAAADPTSASRNCRPT